MTQKLYSSGGPSSFSGYSLSAVARFCSQITSFPSLWERCQRHCWCLALSLHCSLRSAGPPKSDDSHKDAERVGRLYVNVLRAGDAEAEDSVAGGMDEEASRTDGRRDGRQ